MAVSTTPSPAPRDAVLEAAHHLITHHGYAGLSMRELAKVSGLSKGTIYHHFQDKQEIFVSVVERDLAAISHSIAAAADCPGEWLDQLRAVMRAYFDLKRRRHFVIASALREAPEMDQQLHSLVHRYRSEMIRPIATILERGVAAGDIRPINIQFAVLGLVALLHGFVAHRLLLDEAELDDDTVEQTIDQTLDLFLNGIRICA